METSRTKNSIRNFKSTLFLQLLNKVMAFVVRTVFIKMLNSEYLGINGLFTDVLTLLSFAELGIGTAIVFSMYRPIASNDKEKLKSLMQLYRKCYIIIGSIILILGICLTPFLRFIIKDIPNIKENISFIYLLFLINTSISYFFAYKKSIITAYQQESQINRINSFIILLKSGIEIILLLLTKNYILYLIVSIMATFLQNYAISRKADKMFPYLKDDNVKKLPEEETKSIFKNVKSLVIYKVGGIILGGTDNIIMSAMINVAVVGLCSNYTMIINAVKTIISNALNSITASIGNLNATSNIEKKEEIFYELTLINYFVYSFISIAFIVLLNPLITIWLGEEYVLGLSVVIAMSFSFFIEGIRLPAYTYRTTLGLFEKGRITPFIATVVNIASSIVLCKFFGVLGIFIGTCLAQISSYSWIDAYLIHKYEFKKSVKKYNIKTVKYYICFILCTIITLNLSNILHFSGLLYLFINMIIAIIVPNLLNIILLRKCDEFYRVKIKFFIPFVNKLDNKFKNILLKFN